MPQGNAVDRDAVIDLTDPVMYTDPFPLFRELREHVPVARARQRLTMRGTGYLLTRYDDVMRLLTDPTFSSDPASNGSGSRLTRFAPKLVRLLTDSMVFKDDPDHARLRGLVNRAFTPKRVQALERDVEQIVDRLVDDLRGGRVVDFVEAFAVPLPLAVISNMLGVGDTDRDNFHAWLRRFSDATANPLQMVRALPSGHRLMRLFDRLAAERRVSPDGGLVTALVEANDAGDKLDDQEVLAMIFVLLLAGHDTTASLLGSAMVALVDNPGEWERLRAEPDLVDTAVEEFLRYTSPVMNPAPRIPLEDVEFAGVTVAKGSPIIGMIMAANRDESVFPDAERLDVGRTPNRHLAFAFGGHYCLGNQLARLEAKVALRAIAERFERFELAGPRASLQYKPTPAIRGLRNLPLRFQPAPAA